MKGNHYLSYRRPSARNGFEFGKGPSESQRCPGQSLLFPDVIAKRKVRSSGIALFTDASSWRNLQGGALSRVGVGRGGSRPGNHDQDQPATSIAKWGSSHIQPKTSVKDFRLSLPFRSPGDQDGRPVKSIFNRQLQPCRSQI